MVIKKKRVDLEGFWKPGPGEDSIKKIKKKSSKRKSKIQRKKSRRKKGSEEDFYDSREWRKLRYQVIRKYGGRCMACGRSKQKHGVTIHVDHIKPRSKYPHLALISENLQILCEDCNLGKSNLDETDWRPQKHA